MALVSTPKDLPEYRFIHENIPVGTVEKRSTISVKRTLSLQMTPDNFRKLSSGERQGWGGSQGNKVGSTNHGVYEELNSIIL